MFYLVTANVFVFSYFDHAVVEKWGHFKAKSARYQSEQSRAEN